MRKSYVQEKSINVVVHIELSEIETLIKTLDAIEDKSYRARCLLDDLKEMRASVVEEAKREFGYMVERD